MINTVMLVEDEPGDVFLFRRALKQTGFDLTVAVCEHGQQAVDYLAGIGTYSDRTVHPFPELVLLDLNIPHLPGLEVLRWIRAQPHLCLPVTILTSSDSEKDINEAYRCGANSYFVKPTDFALFCQMVQIWCTYWLACNRLPGCFR